MNRSLPALGKHARPGVWNGTQSSARELNDMEMNESSCEKAAELGLTNAFYSTRGPATKRKFRLSQRNNCAPSIAFSYYSNPVTYSYLSAGTKAAPSMVNALRVFPIGGKTLMKRMLTSLGVLIFAAAIAQAETWTGRLLDANCATRQSNSACSPTSATTSFAVDVSGKIMKLDSEGNKKAADALKVYDSGANRAKEPNSKSEPVTATVNGTMKGNQIRVETIEVH